MYEILIVVYLIVALGLVGLVLIQQGKGADMGASFGAGASATLFGSSGAGNFLTRATAILATLFFVISIFLGSLTANSSNAENDLGGLVPAAEEQAPATEDMPVIDNKDSDVPVEDGGNKSSDVPVN